MSEQSTVPDKFFWESWKDYSIRLGKILEQQAGLDDRRIAKLEAQVKELSYLLYHHRHAEDCVKVVSPKPGEWPP